MRVATFNILHGASSADGPVDTALLTDAVASLDADVLALQEVDRRQLRSGREDLAAVAARAMDAVEHRFVAALLGRPDGTWVAADGTEPPHDTAYGIALLSRHPVVDWKLLRLPRLRLRSPFRAPGERLPRLVREEPRVAVAAVLSTPAGRLTVVNTHLSFVPWANGRQLRALSAETRRLPRPLLLTGDLNMGPDRAEGITGMTSLVRAPTFPAYQPREQLDHVLADRLDGGPWAVTSGEARLLPLSDHRALVVDL